MNDSQKFEIIYYNGKPDGVRSIHRKFSILTAYVIPRPQLSEAKKLHEMARHGVYYLISETEDNKIARIYIGQTKNGIERLGTHNRNKDFWDKAILFLADNNNFSLDTISGLEHYLITQANKANRYKVENTAVPRVEIDKPDLSQIEKIYEEIKFIMATQGYKMDSAESARGGENVLHTTRNSVAALGVYSGENFEVLAGSQVDMSRKCYSETLEVQRRTALQNGDIVCEDGIYKTKTVMSFSSPSAAAAFVLGGAANGWTEWKSNADKTLDEVCRQTK